MKNKHDFGTLLKNRLARVIESPVSEREFSNEFELLVAVMLSAQCTDKRVNMVTRELFKKYKTPNDFARLSQSELENNIKSCNYYHNKAKNIILTSQMLVEKFGGQVPDDYDSLIKLPGVGNKTANVVLVVGFGKSAFPVDTHVLRVSNRLGIVNTDNPTECEHVLCEYFDPEDYGLMHHLILLFGRYNCKAKNPNCSDCVIGDICKFKINTSTMQNMKKWAYYVVF